MPHDADEFISIPVISGKRRACGAGGDVVYSAPCLFQNFKWLLIWFPRTGEHSFLPALW